MNLEAPDDVAQRHPPGRHRRSAPHFAVVVAESTRYTT
jgi:hypothetical protein